MIRRLSGRHSWLTALVFFAAVATAWPAAAQSTGLVKGVVKDDKGQPVEGAKVTIEFTGGVSRKFDGKSDKKGEFLQIGLAPGEYKISAEKDKLTAAQTVRVRIGQTSEASLVLGVNAAASSAEAAKKSAELKKVFDEGVAASREGKHDEAIAAFTKAAELNPSCYDCYYNVGFGNAQKKDYDKAEAAYKKAIELKADYAEAYSGLANIYNAQRKFDQASEASAKAMQYAGGGAIGGVAAGGGGSADAMYNQGVILWNAGKIPEAKKQFEAAVAANPNHAESHYQLGMALLNENNLPGAATEFETYLKLSPEGPNAPTAKAMVAQLKK
ncbi:MAG TPA: tetratricopeptide repeat protein [Vicinamibacterales bacterium]|jgi:tetratricopeptide (TPR) repeat protein